MSKRYPIGMQIFFLVLFVIGLLCKVWVFYSDFLLLKFKFLLFVILTRFDFEYFLNFFFDLTVSGSKVEKYLLEKIRQYENVSEWV